MLRAAMPRRALRPLLLATALAVGTTMTIACAAQNTAVPGYAIPADGTLLSVSAQAEATRVPDVATISAGVVTQAADANAAMRANADQMAKVMAAVSRADGSGMVVSCTLSIRTPPVSAVVELLSKP